MARVGARVNGIESAQPRARCSPGLAVLYPRADDESAWEMHLMASREEGTAPWQGDPSLDPAVWHTADGYCPCCPSPELDAALYMTVLRHRDPLH